MKSMVLPSQAYEVKIAPQPAPFSVLKFTGHDAISELYRYEVEFTSPVAHIATEKVLGRPAKFIIDTIDPNAEYLRHMFGENAEKFSDMPPARTIHGVVTQFVRFETSADQTRYKLVIEPRTADLARGKKSRLFQKQSVQEIITETLSHYGYGDGVDFKFQLRAQYKRHEYITQYDESTFAFIQRIAVDEGIWFRFEQVKNREVIIFGDDLDAYARNQRTVPLRRESGLESAGAEAIKTLECHMRRVPESVQLNDYNHRQAGVSLLVEANAARNDTTTNGVDSLWGEHYATPEEGQRIAQLRHEAHLAQQITFKGEGNAFALEVGEVLKLDPNPDQSANVAGRVKLGTIVRSGTTCPQSGVWFGQHHPALPFDDKARFRKGETMPQLLVYRPRVIPFLEYFFGMLRVPTDVAWKLVAYVDQA